jgi:hypothetical protein
MSYKKSEIWQISRELVIDIHNRLNILGKKLNLFLQAIERSIHVKPVTSNQ